VKPNLLKISIFFLISLTIFVYKFSNIPHADGQLKMYFLDVGQGDATLLQTPEDKLILVDGGPDGKVLMSQLARFFPFGNCKLEAVVLTHPDSDHENGLLEVLKRCEVETVIANTEKCTLENCVAFVGATRGSPAGGSRPAPTGATIDDIFQIGNVTLSVLNPPPYQDFSDSSTNDDSIVMDVEFNGFHALLTGDAEKSTLDRIHRGDVYNALKIDVLKVPHHGSFNNFDEAFWEAAKPEVAIVSVGQNSYGHPSPKVLSAVTAMGVKTLRTDEVGTIEVDVETSGNWKIP